MKRLIASLSMACLALVVYQKTAGADGLMDAYKKEFAFLEAEKSALKKRMGDVDKEAAQKVAAVEGELERLQQQILGARARADEIEADLVDAEQKTASADERSDLLAETLDRAFETLSKNGVEVPKDKAEDAAAQAEQIETVFALAGKFLLKTGQVTQDKGAFFDASGTRREGTIVRVGKIAAFGIAGNISGALAPAGAGKLKIWPKEAAASAQAMLKDEPVKNLSLFLFESLEKGIDEKKSQSLYEFLDSGGIIAWVIVWLGIAGVIMVLIRIGILWRASRSSGQLVNRVRDALAAGTVADALLICEKAKGSAARVLKAVIRNLDRERDHLEDIVSEAILHEAPHIERFGSTITVTAAVAPLLGLLGTVTGMISTFDIITEYGTGDPKMLSGGISEALITTELGLIVAIPMLMIGTLLSGRASAILQTLERAALQIMNLAAQPEMKHRRNVPSPKAPKQTAENKPGSKTPMTPATESAV